MENLPPLRSLLAFELFGRHGTMTAAAAEMGVSTGAISQHIRNLEETVGVKLVLRNGNTVKLTPVGKLYLEKLAAGFFELRGAREVLDRARSAQALTISSLRSLATKWLGPRVFDWQQRNSSAKIRLSGDAPEPDLNNGDADFRLTYADHVNVHALHAPLFTDHVVPVCAPALLSGIKLATPRDLLKLPLIDIEWTDQAGQSPNWHQWARHVGEERDNVRPGVTFAFTSAALDAAISGRGCVLGNVSMVADDIASGRLIVPFDIRLPLPAPYHLAWSATAFEKPNGAEFHRWIMTIGKQQEAHSRSGPLSARP